MIGIISACTWLGPQTSASKQPSSQSLGFSHKHKDYQLLGEGNWIDGECVKTILPCSLPHVFLLKILTQQEGCIKMERYMRLHVTDFIITISSGIYLFLALLSLVKAIKTLV